MKTNKTKPIKKIMIFTIITVMIVSLFAVPTFAIDGAPPLSELFVAPTEQLHIGYGDYDPIDVAYYQGQTAVIVSRQDLLVMAMSYASGYCFDTDEMFSFSVIKFDAQYNIINHTTSGVLYLDANNEVWYSVANTSYPISSGFALTGAEYYGLSFTSYPPEFVDSVTTLESDFMERAQIVTLTFEEPTTPDPEEPTDPTPPADGEEQGIFAVWSQITQWIVEGLASVSNAFYANGELTLLGYLCIIPLALGLSFLLIGIIQKFLRLRG